MADASVGRLPPAGHRVELVAGTHPDAAGLLAARRAAYPHWAAGWDLRPGHEFVVVYEGDRPAAGAAIRHGPDGISRASRVCATPASTGTAGTALLDALEAVALGAGSTRLRLDASVFLAEAAIPWQRRGYVTGPPYDGDADAKTWAERTLDPLG